MTISPPLGGGSGLTPEQIRAIANSTDTINQVIGPEHTTVDGGATVFISNDYSTDVLSVEVSSQDIILMAVTLPPNRIVRYVYMAGEDISGGSATIQFGAYRIDNFDERPQNQVHTAQLAFVSATPGADPTTLYEMLPPWTPAAGLYRLGFGFTAGATPGSDTWKYYHGLTRYPSALDVVILYERFATWTAKNWISGPMPAAFDAANDTYTKSYDLPVIALRSYTADDSATSNPSIIERATRAISQSAAAIRHRNTARG